MIILGIETSCDETAAAVLSKEKNRITILSNVVASSASLQSKYGGVIPEQAAREQIRSIIPVIEIAINDSGLMINDIDAIAVTYGPGLIGSLLVGVETAKTLSVIWNKPLIPVNHLLGHFYANWINQYQVLSSKYYVSKNKIHNTKYTIQVPKFPCLGLLASGGHTDLVLFEDHGKYEYLGGTRDDAAGECFDKCARLLGLPYPGGPAIATLAKNGNPASFNLPRPMIDSKDFDFSFSGLKTAVSNIISEKLGKTRKNSESEFQINRNSDTSDTLSHSESFRTDLAASIQQAIIDVLIDKTLKAARKYNIDQIMLAGGVAANQKLINDLRLKINESKHTIKVFVPSAELCTDNAAMIASAAFFQKPLANPLSLQANPNLSLEKNKDYNCYKDHKYYKIR